MPKLLWLLALPWLAPAVLLAQDKPLPPSASPSASPTLKRHTIEQFMKTTRVGGAAFTYDEKAILFHSNQSGIFNVYRVPVSGGEAEQLTHSTKESTYIVTAFPADARFLFAHDRGGDENSHLYLAEPGQAERDLTPGDTTKARFHGWSEDRKSFFFSTNARNPKFFDIFEMPVAQMTPRLVYQDDTGLDFADISNDKRYLAFGKPGGTPADSDVYLYDTSSKELKKITPHEGDILNQPKTFTVDSKFLYFTTDDGSEFRYLARFELPSLKKEVVERARWDIEEFFFSPHGKYQATSTNEDARTKVRLQEVANGKAIDLPMPAPGDVSGLDFSESEKYLAFYLNGSRSPADLFVLNLTNGKVAQLTHSLNPEIDAAELVDAEVVRFPSFDGMQIPALLYRPKEASAEHKVPAIVLVHGGPGGQTRVDYKASMQFLVNHGYCVLGVNNRGSSGYGKTFFKADDQKHGREPLWDCVAAKNYLQSLGYVSNVGILGGSYGGYMVLAALAFQPEVFAVGVDLFGVSNWLRTLQSIPPYWEAQRKSLYAEIGDPSTQEQMLREISPLFHTDKMIKPLLVLQGKNDPRVIKPESDEIVEAIKKKGGVAEYVVFDNEGHGFTKKENEIRGYQAILEFLDRYLQPAAK